MRRIFQHFQGIVESFQGMRFSSVKSLEDEQTGNVITMWFQNKVGGEWYRLFIDGIYCGIDRHGICQAGHELDEGLILVDLSPWFQDKVVKSAEVSDHSSSAGYLELRISFDSGTFFLRYETDDFCSKIFSH